MKVTKVVVLLSGGLDSATCLGLALNSHKKEDVIALTTFYGQKHDREIACAKALTAYYGVKHYICDLSNIYQFSNCSLLQHSTDEVPVGTYAEQQKQTSVVSTYVPFRNGLMLSAAAALALSLVPEGGISIYYGAHADDSTAVGAYPDCTDEFVNAISNAIYEGSGHRCVVFAPFIHHNKAHIVHMGTYLHVPYQLTWSCYEGGNKPCGKCATCIDRAKAFEANHIPDPVLEA